MKQNQRCGAAEVPSGRESFLLRMRCVVKGDGLEPVVAGPAMPEIGDAARTVFNPVRRGDRLAALGARILVGQIAEISTGHGCVSHRGFLVFERVKFERELDRTTVRTQRRV